MHSTKPVKISYARKTTMKTQHHSGLKISRIPCIFICTDMNNQIITNNPRLSVIVSFICAHTNNWMIKNHLSLSENDKHIIRKSRLMSLSSVYIPIQSYIQRYTRTCPYIKILQEIPTHAFHWYLYVCLSSAFETFFCDIHKKSHNFWKHDNLDTRLYQRDCMGKHRGTQNFLS